MEQKGSQATLTKRSFIILCAGLLLIAGVVTIALRKQREYAFFETQTGAVADTSKRSVAADEDVFPATPVLPEPKSKSSRRTSRQEELILPEIVLEDPTANISSDVVHPKTEEKIFTTVDQDAKPREGVSAFKNYIQEKLKYPVQASRLKVEGDVRVEFVVEKNGVLREVRSIDSIGSGCDEEAVRLVSSSPPWSPALLNGKPVRQRRTISVSFKLDRRARRR